MGAGWLQRLSHTPENLTGLCVCSETPQRSWDKVALLAVKSSETLGTRF